MSGMPPLSEEFIRQKLALAEALQQYPVIDELITDSDMKRDYTVADTNDVLRDIIGDKQIVVVGGSYFGDEGKGKVVDALGNLPEITMAGRFNSGQNAGHTVYLKGEKYVFHICPSGIFVPNVDNYIGAECVMDPVTFMAEEINPLVKDGIEYRNKLTVDDFHIVTAYHKLMDLVRNFPDEIPRTTGGAVDLDKMILNNASTLQGIAPVHSAKMNKTCPRYDDVVGNPDTFKAIMQKDMRAYLGQLAERNLSEGDLRDICHHVNSDMKRIPDHLMAFLDAKDKAGFLVDLYHETIRDNPAFPTRDNVKHIIQDRLAQGEKLLAEGPQSYFLSNKVATFYKSATSPDTTCAGVANATGLNLSKFPFVAINVHKFPATRVGRGENPGGHVPQTFYSDQNIGSLEGLGELCEDFGTIQKMFWESFNDNGTLGPAVYKQESNGNTYELPVDVAMGIAEAKEYGECGATTKKPRVTGIFDCVLHSEVMREQGPWTTISAMDRLDNCDQVGAVVAYVYHNETGESMKGANGVTYENGSIIRPGDTLPSEGILAYCHPIVKRVDGWKDQPLAADKWNGDLPENAKSLISIIEESTGANIFAIGNGPEAENMIYLKRE